MGFQDPPRLPRPVSHIFFRGCSEQTRAELLSRLPFREGDILTDDLLQQARQAAKGLHERFGIRISDAGAREELLRFPPEIRPAIPVDGGVNVIVVDPASPPQRIRVADGEHDSMLLEQVLPDAAGAGPVRLAIVVGKDGEVIEAISLSGPESRLAAALDAVRQWRYRPTLLNGRPVEVQTAVEF